MSTGFVLGLSVAVVLILSARLMIGGLPLRNLAKQLSVGSAVISGVGLLGLALHCGAMFFTGLVEAIPGALVPIEAINALGTASIVFYLVPALLVLFGLRRLHRSGVAAVSLALIAVGVTMYDGGPLDVHLAAIFAAAVVLASVAATLVLSPTAGSRNPWSAQAR